MRSINRIYRYPLFVSTAFCLLFGAEFAPGATYRYQTLQYPGAYGTGAAGINNRGDIVGSFEPEAGAFFRGGFLFSGGTYTDISATGAQFSQPNGINDHGVVVGIVGFSTAPPPDLNAAVGPPWFFVDGMEASAINNLGQVAGNEPFGSFPHFLFFDGTTTHTITILGSAFANATGINDSGLTVGTNFNNPVPLDVQGFLYDGTLTTLVIPGVDLTAIADVNNLGVLVGDFGQGPHSGVYNPSTGQMDVIAVPGAFSTIASGVNDRGQVVGAYRISGASGYFGFLATPIPEPGSFCLTASTILLAFAGRRVVSHFKGGR